MADDNEAQNREIAARSLIIKQPEYYFAAERKSLEARLSEQALTQEQIESIREKQGGKVIRDALLGTFIVGKVAKAFIDFNEGVDKSISEAKKSHLLEIYFEKSDKTESSVLALQHLITDPHGSVLFNKIIHILDESPPDPEQFSHLAAALKFVSENNFAKLFSEHKFALSQIAAMTPQALSILANYKHWPAFEMGTRSSSGGKITNDYNDVFADAFAAAKGVSNGADIERLKHSISELISRRFIEAVVGDDDRVYCKSTGAGRSIIPYLADIY